MAEGNVDHVQAGADGDALLEDVLAELGAQGGEDAVVLEEEEGEEDE